MNGVAAMANYTSYKIRGFQSGQLQKYAFVFVSAVILLAVTIMYLIIH